MKSGVGSNLPSASPLQLRPVFISIESLFDGVFEVADAAKKNAVYRRESNIFTTKSMLGNGSNPALRDAKRKAAATQWAEVFALPLWVRGHDELPMPYRTACARALPDQAFVLPKLPHCLARICSVSPRRETPKSSNCFEPCNSRSISRQRTRLGATRASLS